MKQITMYQCEFCSKNFYTDDVKHEKSCREEHERRENERKAYLERRSKDEEMAIAAAKADRALSLLVKNGLKKEAYDRVRVITENVLVGDYGCSYFYETLYDRMIQVAE